MRFFSPSSVHTEGNHTNCWRLGLIEGSHEWLCLLYRQSRSVPDKSSLRYFHGRFWLRMLAQIGAALAPVRSVCGRHKRCTTLEAFFFVGRFVCACGWYRGASYFYIACAILSALCACHISLWRGAHFDIACAACTLYRRELP